LIYYHDLAWNQEAIELVKRLIVDIISLMNEFKKLAEV